jgi:hypothetical protein
MRMIPASWEVKGLFKNLQEGLIICFLKTQLLNLIFVLIVQ